MSDGLQIEPSHMTVERLCHQQFSLRSSICNCKVIVSDGLSLLFIFNQFIKNQHSLLDLTKRQVFTTAT